eukprot:scaffold10438_cov40-Prasinocladus_malaysianus.AAC.1
MARMTSTSRSELVPATLTRKGAPGGPRSATRASRAPASLRAVRLAGAELSTLMASAALNVRS